MKTTKRCLVILLAVSLFLTFGSAMVFAGDNTIIIFDNIVGTAKTYSLEAPDFADAGVKGWTVTAVSNVGVDFFIFKIKAGADMYPIHGGDDTVNSWLAYVVEGGGVCILSDETKKPGQNVEFKKGDYIVFNPGIWHGWKNGKAATTLIFTKLTTPAQ